MQDIRNDYISEFQLKNLRVTNMVFHHESNEIGKLKFDFWPEYNVEGDDIKVSLIGKVFDEIGDFNLQITLEAWFVCRFEKVPDDIREILIQKNSLAIIFPYLRTQVTLMTSQPGLQPIVLPAININAYVDEQKQLKHS